VAVGSHQEKLCGSARGHLKGVRKGGGELKKETSVQKFNGRKIKKQGYVEVGK